MHMQKAEEAASDTDTPLDCSAQPYRCRRCARKMRDACATLSTRNDVDAERRHCRDSGGESSIFCCSAAVAAAPESRYVFCCYAQRRADVTMIDMLLRYAGANADVAPVPQRHAMALCASSNARR